MREPKNGHESFLTITEWRTIAGTLRLSRREAEVAIGVLSDQGEIAIAAQLRVSPRLYRKVGVRSRCQLVARIFETYVRFYTPADRP